MDIRREFAARPPVEDLTSLAALVRDWKWRTAPGGGLDVKRDDVVDFCRDAPDWETAVDRAVRSRRPNGKMHNHQSKVREVDRQQFGHRIRWRFPAGAALRSTGFDSFHDSLEIIRPTGIGPVTTYDVAVRLGAWAGIEPESLYLHAGVRDGWRALMPEPPNGFRKNWAGVRRLPSFLWPEELRKLPADEVEDFLCTYRLIFPDLQVAR